MELDAPVSDEELLSIAGGGRPPWSSRRFWSATGPPYDIEETVERCVIEEYERRRDGCYRTYSQAPLALEPGARELVSSLRNRGVAVALVSTTVARCVLTALDRLRALDLFDVVVTGDMVERRKPHPDPYLRALDLLGVGAGEAVAVEDSPAGIASAHAAGLHAIGYSGCSLGQDLSAADEVVDSYLGFIL